MSKYSSNDIFAKDVEVYDVDEEEEQKKRKFGRR